MLVVGVRVLDLLRSLIATVSAPRFGMWSSLLAATKGLVRWLSLHTGLPAVVVAAAVLVVGFRLMKRTARFAVEVVAVAIALAVASKLGWIRW
jgi:hypothetical protein